MADGGVDFRAIRSRLSTAANTLIEHLEPGKYVLKASYCDCARVVRTDIILPDFHARPYGRAPPLLVTAMLKMYKEYQQLTFGLQPLIPSFRTNEFRHWYMALPGVNGVRCFRLVTTVRTSYSTHKPPIFSGAISAPVDTESIACFDLAQRIMTSSEPLFRTFQSELLAAGCFALRVDCGFNPETGEAFLNELTAPSDAAMLTHAHETELVWRLGHILAEGVVELLEA